MKGQASLYQLKLGRRVVDRVRSQAATSINRMFPHEKPRNDQSRRRCQEILWEYKNWRLSYRGLQFRPIRRRAVPGEPPLKLIPQLIQAGIVRRHDRTDMANQRCNCRPSRRAAEPYYSKICWPTGARTTI